MPESACVRVSLGDAEKAIRALKRADLIDKGLKVRREGGFLVIPVRELSESIKALLRAGVAGHPCRDRFEPRLRRPRVAADMPSHVVIGDIAVFSPRHGFDLEEYRSYAARLLESLPRVRAAYAKVYTGGELRVPRLVWLAGEDRTVTVHKEYGLRFKVDVARVYFNPRLGYEHRRVAESSSSGERVLDMFSGVGGFSLHIAGLRESRVVASDINEVAVYMLSENIGLNRRLIKGSVVPVRADSSLLPLVLKPGFDRIIMNHPTASIRYAGEACRLASPRAIIHVYFRSVSCAEAVERVVGSFMKCCRRAEDLMCREVLSYSPGESIYVVELEV